jgi:hypothetical protein
MKTRHNRVMPDQINLGQHCQSTVGLAIHRWEKKERDPFGRRTVMGYPLPSWQRPLVWTLGQKIRLIESLWLGLNIGTYTYVQNNDPATDGLLIDGQQRMWAIQCYFEDEFSVFGHFWSEVTDVDCRVMQMNTHFSCYIVKSSDEEYLRSYYDMMNFGGTAHTESQRAVK